MLKPQMVRDTSGGVVQALQPTENVTLNVTISSARVQLPSDTELVRIATLVDVYLQFGGSGVTATTSSMLFPAGTEVFNTQAATTTHVAALLVGTASSTLTATKML
jgi:hypothetical protein